MLRLAQEKGTFRFHLFCLWCIYLLIDGIPSNLSEFLHISPKVLLVDWWMKLFVISKSGQQKYIDDAKNLLGKLLCVFFVKSSIVWVGVIHLDKIPQAICAWV